MSKFFFTSISALPRRVGERPRPRVRRRYALEPLEQRCMLSANPGYAENVALSRDDAAVFRYAEESAYFSQSRGADRVASVGGDASYAALGFAYSWAGERNAFATFNISPVREMSLASHDEVFAQATSGCDLSCNFGAWGYDREPLRGNSNSLRSDASNRFALSPAPSFSIYSTTPGPMFSTLYILTLPASHLVSYVDAPSVVGAASAVIVDGTTNHPPQHNGAEDRTAGLGDNLSYGNLLAPPLNRPAGQALTARSNAPGGNSPAAAALSVLLGSGTKQGERAAHLVGASAEPRSNINAALDAVVDGYGMTASTGAAASSGSVSPSAASQGGLIDFGAWNSSLGKSNASRVEADAVSPKSLTIGNQDSIGNMAAIDAGERKNASAARNMDDLVLDRFDVESLFNDDGASWQAQASSADLNLEPNEAERVDPEILSPAELWAQSSTEGGLIDVGGDLWQSDSIDGLREDGAAPVSRLADSGEIRMDASVSQYQSFEVSEAARSFAGDDGSPILFDPTDSTDATLDAAELVSASMAPAAQDEGPSVASASWTIEPTIDPTMADSARRAATPATESAPTVADSTATASACETSASAAPNGATPDRHERAHESPQEAAPTAPAPAIATTAVVGLVALQLAKRKREEQLKTPYRPRYPTERRRT
jgi:hypothetical protein